ncbi:MAG: hypothetical protein WC384_15770 [Prolixibacteraceae bacterium]|jgi:hypothetical protein
MKKVLIVLIAFSFLFAGCEDEMTENPPENTLEANAGIDQQVETNKQFVLDGSKSKDLAEKTFQYLWNIKSKPEGSAATLSDATTVSPKFTADKAGNYLIELKIHNNVFDDTDDVLITATKANDPPLQEPVVINQDINQERRLTNVFDDPTIPDYLVTSDIHVTGHLTIDPSVTIAFEAGKAMYIDNPGSINAVGWGDKDIVFTGKNKTHGFWKGLIINSSSPLNKLERVTIEYGGSNPADGIEVAANLGITSKGNLHLVASVIRQSAAYGMVVESGANWSADSFSNIFENNQTPLRIRASQVNSVDGQSYFANNTRNLIEVVGGTVFDLMEVQWGRALTSDTPALTVPYLIKGQVVVKSGLRIRKGVELLFDSDAEFAVMPTGYLTAIGTGAERIKFHGVESGVTGYWRGIAIKSNSDKNELSYVEVFNAGSEDLGGFDRKAAVALDGENHAKLKLTNSKIEKSGGHGLFVENHAEIMALTFNRFENNTDAAMVLPANEVRKVNNMGTTSFIGNGHNGIEIYGSVLLHPNREESVWPALNFGATYLVSGNLSIQSGLKILPGAAFKFANGKGIRVDNIAYLNAKGTADRKITFTGVNEVKGSWYGIQFLSNSDLNILEYTEILYAGKTVHLGIPQIASISVGGDYVSKLNISHSKIAHGEGYGIVIGTNLGTINSDFETVNQFENLTLGNVYKTATW